MTSVDGGVDDGDGANETTKSSWCDLERKGHSSTDRQTDRL